MRLLDRLHPAEIAGWAIALLCFVAVESGVDFEAVEPVMVFVVSPLVIFGPILKKRGA